MAKEQAPPIIVGFIEGLLAPVGELILAVLLTAGISVTESAGGYSAFLILTFAIIVIVDLVRNVLIGLSHSQFAIGNVIGNGLGIYLFYSAIDSVSHEAATQSVLLTVALVVSFGVGVGLTVRSYFRS